MKRTPLPAHLSRTDVLGAVRPTTLPHLLSGAGGGTDLLPQFVALVPESGVRACAPAAAVTRPAMNGRRSAGRRTR
jgi:hypothetical protein